MIYECSQYVDELLRRKDNGCVKVITDLRRRGMIITPMAECHLYGHLKHTRREVLILRIYFLLPILKMYLK